MADTIRFEVEVDENPPSTLSSDRFLLNQEQVEYVIEAHGKHDEVAQEALNSYETFYLGDWRLSFGFKPVPEASLKDSKAWYLIISKVPDIPLDLPPRLREVLRKKQPSERPLTVEEEWPLSNVK